MFREGFKPKPETVNIIFMDGGVGDHMASLVATNYAIKTYPWIKFLVWVPDFLLDFAKNVMPNAKINNYSSMRTKYNPNLPTKTTKWDGVVSPMKTHVLDYAFLKICDENPGIEHKNYLKINPDKIRTDHIKLSDKYVVLTVGYTASVREFPAGHVNKIAAYIKSSGYEVVFLGQTATKTGTAHIIKGKFDESIDLSVGKNLIDKTTLTQAAKIMRNATAVIGVDNGLLHVAGCTDTPIIGGFTTVNPELRMPVRNNVLGYNYYPIVPDNSLKCSFCQVKTNFLYGHDYVNCLYKDNLCTKQMTAEKFITQLEKFL